MSLYDKIIELFEEEVNERLVGMMNEYIEIISKKHGIAMDLLLKDIPKTFSGTICKGTRTDGKRCTFKGIHDGYCGHHVTQHTQRLKMVSIHRTHAHTHGPEKSFVRGCPECEFSNGLIDYSTMVNNEQN